MALSNRDRVGQAFEQLAVGLDEFITRVLAPELADGSDWTLVLAAKDAQRGGRPGTYSRLDPQCSLRMLSENVTGAVKDGWYPFNAHLSRSEQSLASELRETRNKWAHNASFSSDDAYRALDSVERLLRAAGTPKQAEEVKRQRIDLRRLSAEQEDRKAVRNGSSSDLRSNGLAPWREVLRPHDDVASGNFHAAEFAADLSMVARGEGDAEYTDPVEFFRRTYLTAGLKDLIKRATRRLAGDLNASPVINLQTNFGGGKTHSMLSLWHLASGRPLVDYPQELQDLLSGQELPSSVRRVALVGNQIAPSGLQPKADGTLIRTLWGELAWQLGGREGFALVADADRTSTNPGEALRKLFARYGPAVILIDEWVAYARGLYGRDDLAGGSFDTQFTFAQSLTETAKAVPGVLVVISIPASSDAATTTGADGVSDEEVGGDNGREALRRLQNVVRRTADQWRAASADESFEIVRRRLFATPDGTQLGQISATADAMIAFYRKHSGDFPKSVSDSAYGDRIRRSYPVHPELFDRLYEDWSTLDRFQRTRGVLRLMNTVVGQLWREGDTAPLIMPGSVPLDTDQVLTEISQYLDDRWKPIVDADVDGPTSAPAQVDNEQPLLGARHTTQRLARTVFVGATPTLSTAHKGLDRARLFLGTALPGDVPGNFHSALNHLANRATYFYSSGAAYWYDTQANTTRTARDYAERLHPEDTWAEVKRRLDPIKKSSPRGFAAVHVTPDSSADVPDTPDVRLVIVPCKETYDRKQKDESPAAVWALNVAQRRGSSARVHQNMVVFLAADAARYRELDESIRQYLAWKYVRDNADKALGLTAAQRAQAEDRRDRADQTVKDRLPATFHWALLPQDQPVTIKAIKADGTTDDVAERTAAKLRAGDDLSLQRAANVIRLDLDGPLRPAWDKLGHISFGELWGYYTTYPYLARLRDRSVLADGIASVVDSELIWEQTGFAVATGWDGERYTGLVVPGTESRPPEITDSLLIVQPARALAQVRDDRARRSAATATGNPDDTIAATERPEMMDRASSPASSHTAGDGPSGPHLTSNPTPMTRYFGAKELSSERYAGDFAKIAQEIIAQLAAVADVELEVRVEISARTPSGFDESKMRTIRENATVLNFSDSGFEQS
ncbi:MULTISPECIES: Swt1 family HEPN domain-containing protein [Pseudonocardia]|uniref:Swt1-like HEPN domain-containing protein n=2 Tax=Pseudonocardia TaxID=1847 RepID=A0A1Y2MI88_PSEAH|nr:MULTISPECIES: Swt1 family HEPN domain-containing protein [Pseudonocardia]OSY34986.1 hypothetical protein BG845_06369 [Pseudonocardia autotrophica]TDN73192.1 hypothetical protein C8E95_2276 [Pseudonocardia autotrophica]BBG03922.1 hypothetical protein Pdca_51310 [Pseudonocardia autotrophica]GEC28306.1 hypothetical protein PSA01_53350 [Pseudonocardia saturnea]